MAASPVQFFFTAVLTFVFLFTRFLMVFDLFCAIFAIFANFCTTLSAFAQLLCANFFGSKLCKCCFVSFFHLWEKAGTDLESRDIRQKQGQSYEEGTQIGSRRRKQEQD